jgi:hypothetical protein
MKRFPSTGFKVTLNRPPGNGSTSTDPSAQVKTVGVDLEEAQDVENSGILNVFRLTE